MLTAAHPIPRLSEPFPTMPASLVALAYLEELRSEVLRHLRMPGFIVPTILFPCMFYGIFYCLLAKKGDPGAAIYWLSDYATFGAMAPGLYAFGVSVATERENGFLTFKRALPVPGFAYLAAKLAMAVMVAASSALVLIAFARLTGHLVPGAAGIARLVLVEAVGALPFCALGLLIGSLVRGQSATSVVNILYMPLAFLSGLMVPLGALPPVLHVIAGLLPGYHLFGLALAAATGGPATGLGLHLLYLALFGLIAGGVAQRRLKSRG